MGSLVGLFSAGSLRPGFHDWLFRSPRRALQSGLTGFTWLLPVALRTVTRNKIISWWETLKIKENLSAPDLEAYKDRRSSKAKPSAMKPQPSKEPWSSQVHLSPSTGKTNTGEMKHPS